jgi:very-short-patch-repair endonuclease
VWDAQVAELAGQQFNRISRRQLIEIGMTDAAISRWVAAGRLAAVEEGVFAVAPLREDDDWGRWMGATLTAPDSVLSHASAAKAWGILSLEEAFVAITRPGSGGPRRHGGLLAFRSSTLDGDVISLQGIPVTSISRTLLDLARTVGQRALARAVREAVRLEHTTLVQLGDRLGAYRGRRGSRKLAHVIARYARLPLERARSGAEITALEILRASGRRLPRLNVRIAGEEADLSWPDTRVIVEIDGGPFHLDRGEDARKQRRWERSGWIVRRISSDEVYERPDRLLDLAPNVPEHPSERKPRDVQWRGSP